MHPETDPDDEIARRARACEGATATAHAMAQAAVNRVAARDRELLTQAVEEAGPYADPTVPMPTDSYEIGQWIGASAPREALDNLLKVTEENLAAPVTSSTTVDQVRTAEGLRDNLRARIAYREEHA